MHISQFSQHCGLSAYTLRYYEKIGLLPEITRNEGNHREYSETDVAWVAFIKRLKDTDMPLADIRRYAALRVQGQSTEPERMHLLAVHARELEKKIHLNQEHLKKLRDKIRIYEKSIEEKK